MGEKKTLAERLADARARARKAALQNTAADRRYVREANARVRKAGRKKLAEKCVTDLASLHTSV